MLHDASRSIPDIQDIDVLVIGAGAVGLTLAAALARRGVTVVVLEAGTENLRADYQSANAGQSTGRPFLGLLNGRYKGLGGTTRLWGGQLTPFSPVDFNPAYDGAAAWPVPYDEIAPYYRTALDFLGVKGGLGRDKIYERLGRRPPDLGGQLETSLNLWLKEPDFTRIFAGEIAARQNLHVVTNMAVTDLAFSANGALEGVLARSGDGSRRPFQARRTVLANGTLEIVRTLLHSQQNDAACPFKDNPYIGAGFVDHLHAIAGTIEKPNRGKIRRHFETAYADGLKYSVKIKPTEGFLVHNRLANGVVTLNADATIRQSVTDFLSLVRRIFGAGDVHKLGSAIRASSALARMLLPLVWSYVSRRRSHHLLSRTLMLGVEIEQIPTAGSRLFLDADGAVGVHWDLDGRELDAALALCQEVARQFETHGLGTVVIDPKLVARDPAFLDKFHDAFHHIGGARMGRSAADGVVDRDLKVFGASGLWVLGAAAFPTGSYANPTLTALAMTHRLADHLAGDLSNEA